MDLPNKRPDDMARITTAELANKFIEEQIALVKQQVGDKKVLLALSGGVDSSVASRSTPKPNWPDKHSRSVYNGLVPISP